LLRDPKDCAVVIDECEGEGEIDPRQRLRRLRPISEGQARPPLFERYFDPCQLLRASKPDRVTRPCTRVGGGQGRHRPRREIVDLLDQSRAGRRGLTDSITLV
jgi:hypothetical protein